VFLAHFVAKDQGYYEQEGIKIEESQINTSDLIADNLVAGHINAAIELSITSLLQVLVIVTVLEYMHIGVLESSIGIGTLLDRENTNHDNVNVFALVLLIGVIGFSLNWITEKIQYKWKHWSNENLKNE
jgi:hypothetical protein